MCVMMSRCESLVGLLSVPGDLSSFLKVVDTLPRFQAGRVPTPIVVKDSLQEYSKLKDTPKCAFDLLIINDIAGLHVTL